MQRVVHPTCCGCGTPNPAYISESYQVRVCYPCLLEVCRRFLAWGIELDDNPLATELFDGVFTWSDSIDTRTHFPVVTSNNLTGSRAYNYKMVKRFQTEK